MTKEIFVGTTPEASVSLRIGLQEVTFGVCPAQPPDFDDVSFRHRNHVLLRVKALSANFRDKALIVDAAFRGEKGSGPSRVHFGSEFAAEVAAVGRDVDSFMVGDLVMPNAAYPTGPEQWLQPGIVTNGASAGWLVLPVGKLMPVPPWMSDVDAAAYSLSAQTAVAMVRQGQVTSGSRVLVLSGRSSTSLAVLSVLQRHGAEVYVASSRSWSSQEKHSIGHAGATPVHLEMSELAAFSGYFDVVIDPFIDMHVNQAVPTLRPWGRYVTCGYVEQHPLFQEGRVHTPDFHAVMGQIITGNVSIVGNCIGTTEDLQEALAAGPERLVPVDSVFSPDCAGDFLDRTFNDRSKLGKVVLRLDE